MAGKLPIMADHLPESRVRLIRRTSAPLLNREVSRLTKKRYGPFLKPRRSPRARDP